LHARQLNTLHILKQLDRLAHLEIRFQLQNLTVRVNLRLVLCLFSVLNFEECPSFVRPYVVTPLSLPVFVEPNSIEFALLLLHGR